jgi:hypothetical protein
MYRLLALSLIFIGCSYQLEQYEIENPANDQGKYPRLFTDNSGVVYMNWYKDNNDSTQLFYSMYDDDAWSEPQLIAESNNWFVNWADFPSIIGYDGKPIAAHWLTKTDGGTYSYDVSIALANSMFNYPFVVHDDNTPTEHGFVSMIPLSDSSFYAIWLDGRNTQGGHSHDHLDEHISDLSTAMTLRGALLNTKGEILDQEIDPSLCDCCNTSLVQTSNNLLVAYRDRSESEIRDIYVSSYSFINESWSTPTLVHPDNWQIAACPVNGPMMDAFNDNVALSWFTGADDIPLVKLSFSSDAGNTFSDPIIVDESMPLGRVDVLIENSETAWVSWITRSENSALLKLAKVSKNYGVLKIHTINEIDPSRSSGFPQLTKLEQGMMVAWTDISESKPKIRTKIIR